MLVALCSDIQCSCVSLINSGLTTGDGDDDKMTLLEISGLLPVTPVSAHLARWQPPQLVLVLVAPGVGVGLVVVLAVDVVIVNTRLLLDDLGPGAAAGHGAAQEDVDE